LANVLEVLQDALVIDTRGLLLLETRSLLLETILVTALSGFGIAVGIIVGIAVSRLPSLEGHSRSLQTLLAALQIVTLGTSLLAIAMLTDLQGCGWWWQGG